MSDDYTIEQIKAHFDKQEKIEEYLYDQLHAAGLNPSWGHMYVDKYGLNYEIYSQDGYNQNAVVPLEDIVGHTVEELRAARKKREEQAWKAAEERAEKARRERERAELKKARELVARYENRHPDEELG